MADVDVATFVHQWCGEHIGHHGNWANEDERESIVHHALSELSSALREHGYSVADAEQSLNDQGRLKGFVWSRYASGFKAG